MIWLVHKTKKFFKFFSRHILCLCKDIFFTISLGLSKCILWFNVELHVGVKWNSKDSISSLDLILFLYESNLRGSFSSTKLLIYCIKNKIYLEKSESNFIQIASYKK